MRLLLVRPLLDSDIDLSSRNVEDLARAFGIGAFRGKRKPAIFARWSVLDGDELGDYVADEGYKILASLRPTQV